ncbi:MAG: hypothetical protein WCD79_04015 [Chthoniobacteraceae bacterium]
MNRHDFATLGIRFAALYALFEALEYFAGGFINLSLAQSAAAGKEYTVITSLVFFLPSALLAIVGILLFTRAPRLADYFLPQPRESSSSPTTSTASPSIGFAIVGLAGCLYSTPRLVPIIVRLFQAGVFSASDFNATDAKRQFMLQLPQLSGIVLQLLLSFVMLVKSQALATWWQHKQARPVN